MIRLSKYNLVWGHSNKRRISSPVCPQYVALLTNLFCLYSLSSLVCSLSPYWISQLAYLIAGDKINP